MKKISMAVIAGYLGASAIAADLPAQEVKPIKFGNNRELTYAVTRQGERRTSAYHRADEDSGQISINAKNAKGDLSLHGILDGVRFDYLLGAGIKANSLILSKNNIHILFFDCPSTIGGKDWASVHFWDTGQRATVYAGNSDAYQQPVPDKNPENMTMEEILRKVYSKYTESLNVNAVVDAYKPLEAVKLKPMAEKFEEPKPYKQLMPEQPAPEQLRAALISFLK